LTQVPNGIYNLACYGIDGSFGDRGTTFVVNGANGVVSNSTVNASGGDTVLLPGVNTVIFTNIQVSGGTLDIDCPATSPVPTHNPNTENDINAIQVQLVQAFGNPATISSVKISGGNVIIKGSSIDVGQRYRVLSATNLMIPLPNWVPLATNTFASGGFTNTIPVNPANRQRFYLISEP
jgi:hypothetical protein